MVELVEVAEARLDDAEELVAIRRQEALGLLATERAERFLDRLDRRARRFAKFIADVNNMQKKSSTV